MKIISILLLIGFIFYIGKKGFVGTDLTTQIKSKIDNEKDYRINLYRKNISSAWLSCLVIVLISVFVLKMDYVALGFGMPTFNSETLGWFTYVILAIMGIYFSLMFILFAFYTYHRKLYNFETGPLKEDAENFKVILPTNKREEKYWELMSFTAGFTEEIFFRSYLFALITISFPNIPIWACIIFAGVLFGFAHSYQGVNGIITTGIFALVFMSAFIIFGSIIPLILYHWFVDHCAKYSRFDMTKKFKKLDLKEEA